MFKLSTEANKAEYLEHMDQEVLLGKKVVKIVQYTKDGRSGSYERGFKFSSTTYGGLLNPKTKQVSFNHGVTWVRSYGSYHDYAFKECKTGRVRLSTNSRKEFAFDSIQDINRSYDPNFKWKP